MRSADAGAPDNLTADFGYYVEPAAVGNFVWNDLNGNGIQDPGELGIAGVKVELTITYPDATVVTVVTVTDSNGYYSFGNLLLDEDFNGEAVAPEPTHSISVVRQPATPRPLVGAPGSTATNDFNAHTGTPAQPVQGQNEYAAGQRQRRHRILRLRLRAGRWPSATASGWTTARAADRQRRHPERQ